MSTLVQGTTSRSEQAQNQALVANKYGHFSPAGDEFWITNPKTPRPWANIIANPRLGFAVSQTGGGFTWIDNSQLAVITRWQQEFNHDSSGKFLYLRDADSGELWSLSPAPLWPEYDKYTCCHGLGFTTFETEFAGIHAEWTLFVHSRETVEYWLVSLQNLTDRARRLEICSYLEWCCGVTPDSRREFHKLFIETSFDPQRGIIFARNHMWDIPSSEHGHWNTDFPYVSALACTVPIVTAQGDKTAFLGRNNSPATPQALSEDRWTPTFGRHEDPIAALRGTIHLLPNQQHKLGYVLAVAESQEAVDYVLAESTATSVMEAALSEARSSWKKRLAAHRVETPDVSLNYLTNDWLRYQAIAGRIWGRCGYYQQSGAYGFRDQLQDSQVWLTIDPKRCRDQISRHSARQFADGSVYHWWHPLSEQGHITKMTDDLLWLAFVTVNYIKEVGNYDILWERAPFLDDPAPRPLVEHIYRAFERVFKRTSPRGLPHIGAGDWNDGLSAVGLAERGESIWLGHFLAGLLDDWSEIFDSVGDSRFRIQESGSKHDGQAQASNDDRDWKRLAQDFRQRRHKLVTSLNEHGWDGQWYIRATLDDGTKLGSAECRVGRIFLNAQTWAVLNDVATSERAAQCMSAVKEYLISEAGALLLAPAFDRPDSKVGYITRYAPGLRENGGVYTHAATWAIAAACKLRDHDLVQQLLTTINPANKDPDRYWAEPYVAPGNVDGPDSPHHCRGGWSWYTGAAAWLHRVINEWVLGIRPTFTGLLIDPCLPHDWAGANVIRPWRGCTYEIEIKNAKKIFGDNRTEITLDDNKLETNIVPPPDKAGITHKLIVVR